MTVKIKIFVLLFAFWQQSCQSLSSNNDTNEVTTTTTDAIVTDKNTSEELNTAEIIVGAQQIDEYLPYLVNKRVGLLVNQTSMLDKKMHLVDFLNDNENVSVQTIFAPEHGFRGKADAGEHLNDGIDSKTGVKIISLYGKHRAPTKEDFADIDVLIFDIQDVGVRFYTYISTLHYLMKAGAENNVQILVLDRPNPNGHYVDGPMLDPNFKSFVGMHPIPIVHGMTIGEYAQMINGQNWLGDGLKVDLKVVKCVNYNHSSTYVLPIPPSPNLPNNRSIYLYPSLCFFEGTVFSIGRGTNTQFQIYGHPDFSIGSYQFTPKSGPGSKYPKHENKTCSGISLVSLSQEQLWSEKQLNLFYIIQAYQHFNDKENFFLENHFIDKLAGSSTLREQIIDGLSQEEIRASWQDELEEYKQMRKEYLLYEE